MLLLLFKNFIWAAWWPYCTMLLAMEKAARQRGDGSKPPPSKPPPQDRGQVPQQESSMANDAFMKPEIPEALRELMKMSIEQARRAFETFVSIARLLESKHLAERGDPVDARVGTRVRGEHHALIEQDADAISYVSSLLALLLLVGETDPYPHGLDPAAAA